MPDQTAQERIAELEQQIAALPIGSIGKKTVNGKEYFYHRWTENKKRREKYIPSDEVAALQSQIDARKALKAELRQLRRQIPVVAVPKKPDHAFRTNVRTDAALRSYAAPVKSFKKRDGFQALHDYIYGPQQDKVFILCGLRRTGKTTLIRQILSEMSDDDLTRTALVQITPKDTLADVNQDLKYLESAGYRYAFFDEVTLMEDFISGAALFSDVYAASGMKIVLSGTDSLGFLFTENEELYDRCIMLHTTFIPYREFERVLGIKGIDEYIRYGGTMSIGGVHYNETSTFATKASADEYVDSAIARNIQHSLRYYQDSSHFRHLLELYQKNELTSAINRVVEDQTYRFTVEVLTREFKSNDMELSARNLRSDRAQPNDVLDCVDIESVTLRLKNLLEIRNKAEQSVAVDSVHAEEIKEYLTLLDLTQSVDVVAMPSGEKMTRTVIAQPGLRYAQASALIESLLLDPEFRDLSINERNAVQERILSTLLGRMMEDVVLLETKLANPKKQVFVLQFAIGEFDMVVFDPATSTCKIYEIKHSAEVVPEQMRYLLDAEKCKATEHRYGKITGKYVIYRGGNCLMGDVQYLNVEEYLYIAYKSGV